MDTEEPIHTEILVAIGIYLITPLFTKSLLDPTKNTSSSFSTSLSSNDDIQTYFFFTIYTIKTTRYLIPRKIIPKFTNIIDICLNIN